MPALERVTEPTWLCSLSGPPRKLVLNHSGLSSGVTRRRTDSRSLRLRQSPQQGSQDADSQEPAAELAEDGIRLGQTEIERQIAFDTGQRVPARPTTCGPIKKRSVPSPPSTVSAEAIDRRRFRHHRFQRRAKSKLCRP